MKSRSFTFTNFNLNSEEVFNKHQKQIRFMAFGDEICPKTKKKHQQGFLYFHNQMRSIKNIANLFKLTENDKPQHIEIMRGSFKENEAYCSKEGSYTKLGDEPSQGLRGDLNELKKEILDGNLSVDDIVIENPMMFHQYGRTLSKIEEIALRKKYRSWMTTCLWIYGETGTGKSHKAFENFHPDTHYVKNLNTDFWDGYTGQETVILNEFRGQIKFSELLDLIDKYPKTVNIKGKPPVPFLAKHIIITSCKKPTDIYYNLDESHKQLERRIQLLEMAQKCSNR